jgi:metallo-beta-lactamase class B
MSGDAEVVRTGGRKDFAFGTDGIETFPRARIDRVLHDGDVVALGGVNLTAHLTGGHTRGCTTWTLRTHLSTDPAGRLRNVVIVGGLRALTQYRLLDRSGHPASYPGIKVDFYKSFAKLESLPCDIFLGAHGVYFDLLSKAKRMNTEGEAAFIDPRGYVETVQEARTKFEKMVAMQASQKKP